MAVEILAIRRDGGRGVQNEHRAVAEALGRAADEEREQQELQRAECLEERRAARIDALELLEDAAGMDGAHEPMRSSSSDRRILASTSMLPPELCRLIGSRVSAPQVMIHGNTPRAAA